MRGHRVHGEGTDNMYSTVHVMYFATASYILVISEKVVVCIHSFL